MTGPATGEPDRSLTAPMRTSGTRNAASAILILLALGFALRLIIAYLLPGSGFANDLASFRGWADDLFTNGLAGFYQRPGFHDYTPGYLYYLWLLGALAQVFPSFDLVKIPAILSDLAIGWLIWSMILELGGGRRAAILGAALYLFVPVSWFDSVVWGQVDSVGIVFLLLSVRALWRDRPELASVFAVVAALIKPQLGIIIFVAAAVLLRRYLVDPLLEPAPAGEGARSAEPVAAAEATPARSPTPLSGMRGPVRLLTSAVAGLGTAVGLSWPFGLDLPGLIDQVFKTAGGYPYITVNAYNPWALVERAGSGLAASGQWLCDAVTGTAVDTPCPPGSQLQIAGLPALVVGGLLMALVLAVIFVVVMWRPERETILVGVAVLALALFVVPTRVHERYLFPFFAVGAILAAVSWRWRAVFGLLALANFLNLYVVLTTLYPDNPQISDWLGIGGLVRSRLGVTAVALLHTGGFVWAALQLRTGAARVLSAELATTAEPAPAEPAPVVRLPDRRALPATMAGTHPASLEQARMVAPGSATAPGSAWSPAPPDRASAPSVEASWSAEDRYPELGLLAPLTRRIGLRPTRADRSHALHGEPGGRLDRLDVWILVVVTIAALGLRTWRLAEPYAMHFDEVYHARTATEFLQDWRYGEPHSIYEFTHPHLAKYAMAAGIVAWGDDRVTARSNLAVPVLDAAIEQRWDDPTMPDHRAGDRLYVATGAEVRAYDLRTRELLAALPAPGVAALAIDPDGHRLFTASADGDVFELDTIFFDTLRSGGDARLVDPPAPFGSFEGPIRRLFATSDGSFLLAITGADDVISMDAATGQTVGSVSLEGAADIAPAGSAEGLVANVDELTDPIAEAKTLAELVGGDQQELERRLTSSQGRVVVSGTVDAASRSLVEGAIGDGRLAGFSFESLPSIAVADTQGVSFLSPADLTLTDEVPIAGGASGLALTSNLDAPRLYVAAGRAVTVIKLASSEDTGVSPSVETTVPMPGPVSRVTFDASSVMVHVLGTSPEGSASTIYVIEPHAQAVYADARLPFAPVAWATDVDPQLPSADREAVLAFDPGGSVASVDVGQHAFSWRMPGVIAGALTAALLYLLARVLFRRRSVGVLVATLSLADGMLFVQSRIAMNDAYVGLFMIAGYVLFAGLWTGIWQRRWAFWVGMPAIGLLMGLALASKWVAAYAIAAMAVLILVRSALGRILTILGLIAVTVVLGYQGLTYAAPAAGETATGSGNVLFIMLMIGLTLVATAVTVFHPIAWSLEELRIAVAAPAAAGLTVGLLAIPLADRQARVALGPLAATPSTVAVTVAVMLLLLAGGVAVAFSVAGRMGLGPLAPPLEPDDPARLAEPPAPAPTGWLRPGWGFGVPVVWTVGSLLVLPVIVYVISYVPWALNSGGPAGSPQIFPAGTPLFGSWPPGRTGQTLWDLTKTMYDYHNNLRATHAASSPWWAWPFDLKPVWFYQGSFAGGTAAAIYDAGNLVIWWLGVPAMAFAAWQAFKRRSLALALVTIAFAFQWLSWSRIDRATFQYHYYTSVPFIVLALSYLLAELWHGASRRTWLLARASAAVAVMGPGLLWLFKTPLCVLVGVDRAYKDSPACHGNPGDFVLTTQVGIVVLVGVLAAVAFAYEFSHLDDRSVFVTMFGRGSTLGEIGRRIRFPLTGLILIAGMLAQGAIPADQELVSVRGFATTPLALVAVVILGFLASFVLTARDARRFVLGTVFAAVAAFIVLYPNIAALPLPSTVFNAYQGLLPTYLYPFQFPVNTDPPPPPTPLLAPVPALLFAGLAVACLVVAYSAWSWRIVLAERRLAGEPDDDALARTG